MKLFGRKIRSNVRKCYFVNLPGITISIPREKYVGQDIRAD